MINIELFKKLLQTGQFALFAKEYFSYKPEEILAMQLDDIVINNNYDGNICGYGLSCYLNFIRENIERSQNISTFFEIDMPYIIGAYQASLAHTFRRIELNPEKESLYCDIYCIDMTPEGNLPEGEILEIAQMIISKWPHNETAQRIIDNRKNNPEQEMSVAEKITHAIAIDKKAAFKDLILSGRYIETRQILPMLTDDEIEQLIFEIAEQEHNVCSYDYVWFWMRECGETAQRHSFLAKVTSESFKYDQKTFWEDLPGTNELIFFHTYRAAELEPENIELQEKLLSLYELGNESFDVKETKKVAERVLAAKPESAEALRVLKFLG